ncbi:urea transporter [Marinobacterium nitratireducens]|uniref:Urea transporter n=1 Tax=Marinobacterium nitratireducens TaxID=518897 RepID=A0A917ZRZ3_9GAMM|nr:urea transporter [Marinobacterium nitratireducens]GGO89235.1 urea transporter [Marinobacterium nitratireducens]
MDKTLRNLSYWLDALLHSFSQILFQSSRHCGLLLLLAIGVESPWLLAGGLCGCLAALLGAGLGAFDRDRLRSGDYGYNGALLGLGVTALGGLSQATLALIALLGVLSVPMLDWQLRRLRLPPYTSVFVLLGWCAWGLLPLLQAFAPVAAEAVGDRPLPVQSVMQGLGQVLFLGSPLAALLVLLGLTLASARDAGWALIGALTGNLVASGLPVAPHDLHLGLYGFNGALAAIALSRRFGPQPLLILTGSAVATLLQPLLAQLGIPPFTAPFVLSCWLICLMTARISTHPEPTP